MAVTRVSRAKRSSDCAVGTLEFEFKFIKDISSNSISYVPTAQSDDRLVRETRVAVILIFYLCTSFISALHV